MADFIKLCGCRLHNLKNVDVQIPLGKITTICGPSGCGKSTLVLDTLHGECKRRYLETLSPFAADLLGGKKQIQIDSAEGLSASLAIGPSHGEAASKSYALSIAECDNSLRTLFAHFAKPACPICGEPMNSFTRENIIKTIASKNVGTKLQFLAPIESANNSLDKLSAVFLSQGFTRAIADGIVYSLADLQTHEKKQKPKSFFIIVDRIIIRENNRTRIAEAVDATLKLTHSIVVIETDGIQEFYNTTPRCKNANDSIHFEHKNDSDFLKITSLSARSFSPHNKNSMCNNCLGTGFIAPKNEKQFICKKCSGNRLSNIYLNASIDNVCYSQILETPFSELGNLCKTIFEKKIGEHLKPIYSTLQNRIQAINDLGIGYLTAGRSGKTLSGGEIQRLRLASLSTGLLNGLIIVLDEPASGLHESDVNALWNVLENVCNRGNTLVLIEHNPLIIKRSNYIIEMGPGAGEKGGEILLQGKREDVLNNPKSLTATWIKEIDNYLKINKSNSNFENSISVKNFHLYDMLPVNAKFPLKKFSVITGQSGSGKSTLLFENIAKRAESQEFKSYGIEALSILATGDFHGNKRSTVLSAIDLTSKLKELFAKLPESKIRGYTASKFTTHAPGGRCENCKGEGVIYDPSGYEESECPVCQGKRFRDEVLEIRFKSLSIADILELEVDSAYNLFTNFKPFVEKLKPLVDTGLGYLRLGQTTAHLSGGERARLRLSIALSQAKAPNTLFLFDEPARGLHKTDIELLLNLIRKLCDAGHTIIAIEHSIDFINAADNVIELKRPTFN